MPASGWVRLAGVTMAFPLAGVILERSALATGFAAAAIAVGGFAARSLAIFAEASAETTQRYTALGGMFSLLLSLWVVLLDAGIG